MQNPKKALVKGEWYRVREQVALTIKHHENSRSLTVIPKGAMVFFLNYHPGDVRRCRVMYGELVGWIRVGSCWDHSFNFFYPVQR